MLYIRMATLCMKNIEQTQKIQEGKNKEKKKQENQSTDSLQRERELRKEGRELLVVSPQA